MRDRKFFKKLNEQYKNFKRVSKKHERNSKDVTT